MARLVKGVDGLVLLCHKRSRTFTVAQYWQCLAYMAVGKFLRYLAMTSVLLYFMPGHLAI